VKKQYKVMAIMIVALLACGAGYYGYQSYSFNKRVQTSYKIMEEQIVKQNATNKTATSKAVADTKKADTTKAVAAVTKKADTTKTVAAVTKKADTTKTVAAVIKKADTTKTVADVTKKADTTKTVADVTKTNDTDKALVYEILKDSDLEYAYITHNGDTVMLTVKFTKGILDKDKYLKVSKYMDIVSAQYKDKNVNVTMIPN